MKKNLCVWAILAPLIYIVSYLSLVQADPLPVMTGVGPWPRVPSYLVGGKAAEIAFAPVQYLDKHIRPEYWQEP
jgi:hypothetical protein